jgi:hypothetical protein
MTHFETAESWQAASALLTFEPRVPKDTVDLPLSFLRVHVRDHKRREVPLADRTLEAHYGKFSLSQCRKGVGEARRSAIDVAYGQSPFAVRIAGNDGRAYPLGPEVPPDDIDGRSPAVVTWADGDMHYLVASGELPVEVLIIVAASLY